jgi:hypothetical protein
MDMNEPRNSRIVGLMMQYVGEQYSEFILVAETSKDYKSLLNSEVYKDMTQLHCKLANKKFSDLKKEIENEAEKMPE